MTEPNGDPGGPRRLDRAPGERYRGMPERSRTGTPGDGRDAASSRAPRPGPRTTAQATRRGVLAALGVALVAAVLRMLLGQVDVGIGLFAVAAAIGWLVALALIAGSGGVAIPRRPVIAAILAVGAIAAGVLLEWGLALVGGGALGPLDYVGERYGPIAWIEAGIAGGVAWLRAR